MNDEPLSTHHKAFHINLDSGKHGTFAEIGAGQEVARWFFRVGAAAGTIAKTISAYDMTVSDAIYGRCERYVSRQRLQTMLDHEYNLMIERLDAKRGATTRFFVFADTVTARSYLQKGESHGWLGIRFQTEPRSESSDIIIHVRMWDRENIQQQETLGILGVNLVYGALYYHRNPQQLIQSLPDNLTTDRIEIDMIKFSGPAFHRIDNRLMSLQLVEHGMTNAVMFTADGEVVQAAELLHKKAVLVERGSFRPVTYLTLDMLDCAQAKFVQEPKVLGEDILILMEMTLRNLSIEGNINHQDFLDRVDLLSSLGKTVLVSNYGEYYRLASYLFRYTKKMCGIVLGVPSLKELFDEKYYANLEGGILESFGRLFKNDLKLYIYPLRDPKTDAFVTADNLQVAPHLRHLYAYFLENQLLETLRDVNHRNLRIFARDVLERIRKDDSSWETMVPPKVSQIIKERKLFSYQTVASASDKLNPAPAVS